MGTVYNIVTKAFSCKKKKKKTTTNNMIEGRIREDAKPGKGRGGVPGSNPNGDNLLHCN